MSSSAPMLSPKVRLRHRWSAFLMMTSGFAGLGYQIVWTQQGALWLGHEAASVLAVVAAFFAGLALGSLAFGERIEKSSRPLRWYAGCELAIALWSGCLIFALPPLSELLLQLTGVQPTAQWQWTVAFAGTFVLLLPATVAMGATLPAMERLVTQISTGRSSIAALYAANTLGAVLGVLAAAFWLVPQFGFVRTAGACVLLNVICALSSSALFSNKPVVQRGQIQNHAPPNQRVLPLLAITGLLGIGYEVLAVRVLSEVTEDTVYTFALLLAVYLIGTAIGAVCYQRWQARHAGEISNDSDRLRKVVDQLLGWLAVACLLGAVCLWNAEHIKRVLLEWSGSGLTKIVSIEAALALTAFGPATLIMGALFCHLNICASGANISFGRAIGVNLLGSAAAPLVFGVIALPLIGAKFTLLALVCGYLLLMSWRMWRRPFVWLSAAATLLAAVWSPPLAFIDIPQGGHVISYQEGVMAAVSVVQDANGVAVLRINNRQQEGSSATLRVDARQAWLPILLHPAPHRALFLGLGTGVTASSAVADPNLEVDAVELLPEVIKASAYFTSAVADTDSNSRLHLLHADARRYVRAADQHYDVIVSDNFHPARSGSGALYTVEHFAAVRQRLADGGVFCQWLALHQLDLATLRSIMRSFLQVYPDGWAMLANNSLETPVLGLIGRADTSRFDVAALRARLSRAIASNTLLAEIGIEDEFALFGSFISGPAALQQFSRDAPINTDDHPVVTYLAPRITYAAESLPGERLVELLRAVSITPSEVGAALNERWSNRLAAYWSARNRFVESGREVHPTNNVGEMLAQVSGPLLLALRISPDFRPAYDPLLRMAMALAPRDVASARTLLTELMRIQPARAEAQELLNKIDASHG
jgi:spermidine synthase